MGLVGFEPTTKWLRVTCSTTEPQAQVIIKKFENSNRNSIPAIYTINYITNFLIIKIFFKNQAIFILKNTLYKYGNYLREFLTGFKRIKEELI